MAWRTSAPAPTGISASLMQRARRRTVFDVSESLGNQRSFVVAGEPKLGDHYARYEVERNGDGSWHCSCYDTNHGESRARKLCSHVVAVMLKTGEVADDERDTVGKRPARGASQGAFDLGTAQPVGFNGETADERGRTVDRCEGVVADRRPRKRPARPIADRVHRPDDDKLTDLSTQTRRSTHERDGREGGSGAEGGTALIRRAIPNLYTERHVALPEWVEYARGHQLDAVEEIIEHFRSGAQVVYLDAPTGSGKSLIGELVRRGMGLHRAAYLCTTKTLQAQVASTERGFGTYARVLMGRDNYPTEHYPERFTDSWRRLSCAECTGRNCNWCEEIASCPYVIAKNEAAHAPLSILNVAYWLGETQSPRSMFRGASLVVCDEADTLEQELMRHVAVEVSDRRMREFGIDKPKVTVAEDWVRWARDEALPAAQAALANVPPGMDEVDAIRRENALGRLVGRLGYLANGEAINKWVYAGAGKRKTDDMTVAFKPFVVDHLAQEYLWETGQRWLCMSATVISRDVEAMALGLDPDDVPLVSVPNTFPVENRPIHIETVAELTYDKEFRGFRPKDLEAAARKVEEIGLAHPDERILVHTVSFVLARYFMENCPRIRHRFVMYEDSKGRDEVLRKFTTTPAAICLAPSFERGIDLPGDLCRVNVIAKIPFPSLGDPLVDARLRRTANGDEWYRVQTVRRLVQATGRATRSADDWSKTYIIDRSFITKVWRKSRKYLPKWWKDAIVWKRGQVGRG